MFKNTDELKAEFDRWTAQNIEFTDPDAIRQCRDKLVGSGITMDELVNVVNTYFSHRIPVKASPGFIDALLDNANVTRW